MGIVLIDEGLKFESWKDDGLIEVWRGLNVELYGKLVATPGRGGIGDASWPKTSFHSTIGLKTCSCSPKSNWFLSNSKVSSLNMVIMVAVGWECGCRKRMCFLRLKSCHLQLLPCGSKEENSLSYRKDVLVRGFQQQHRIDTPGAYEHQGKQSFDSSWFSTS